jgi:hypothetical protein
MYQKCRLFSCQRTAKEKLLLDNHDKNRRFVPPVMRFFEKNFGLATSWELCIERTPNKQNKIGAIVLKNTFYKVLPVRK